MSSQTTPWILILAIWVHICFGIALIANEEVSRIAILAGINTITDPQLVDHTLTGLIIITFALMASLALIFDKSFGRNISICLMFPQYAVLLMAVVTDIYVLITREVSNREVNFWTLFSALNIMIGLGILHTGAVLERYWRRWIQVQD